MSTHWKQFMDRDFLYAFDLQGRDITVTIAKVEQGNLTAAGGRKSKKPLLYFVGKEKPLALNATNAKTIAAMYGNYVEKWVGQRITMYPTITQMNGESVECIRIKPTKPAPAKGKGKDDQPEPEADDSNEAAGETVQ